MNIEELRKEIRLSGFVKQLIHIGEEPYCDNCFNLIKRPDGKWESSFVEKGHPDNRREYETEEEAAEDFLKILRKECPKEFLSIFARWKRDRKKR